MPIIYLKETGSYEVHSSGSEKVSVNVSVIHQSYQISKLFKCLKHSSTDHNHWKSGQDIKISDNKDTMSVLTLKPDEKYASKELDYACVYFNTFDSEHKNPLLLSLHFKNILNEDKNIYFQYSEIKQRISSRRETKISDMRDFTKYDELNRILISENRNTNNSLTFLINRVNNDDTNKTYNSGNITISKKQEVNKNYSDGFYKYTHTPKSGVRKSHILYNMNVLADKNKTPIKEIQDQFYLSITVYFGTRAKSSVGKQRNIPLLIELNKTSPPNEPEYYVHKRKPDGGRDYYWEKLNKKNLKIILKGIGFSLVEGQSRYRVLTSLVADTPSTLRGVGHDSSSNSDLKGSKLKKRLDMNVGGSSSSIILIELVLNNIEFDLLDSVIILLEKNRGSSYDEQEVKRVLTQLEYPRDINRVKMDNGSKKITMEDKTVEKGTCVKEFNYKFMCHDINKVVNGLSGLDQSSVGIRFVIPSQITAAKYNQLTLYNNDKTEPQYVEYLYYSTSNKNVYVYFYGDDPRPLLLCYGKDVYKPKNLNNTNKETQVNVDYKKWVKVTNISNCTCTNGGTTGQNEPILRALNEVTGYLNPVQINPKQIPSSASGTITKEPPDQPAKAEYKLHDYNKTTTIKMGISRGDVGCYHKFTYQPNGTNGGGSNRRHDGFRLGNILHTKTNRGGSHSFLKYTTMGTEYKYHPLIGVTVFYYDHDSNYDDPLLIELEFNEYIGGLDIIHTEYYRLQLGDGSDGNGTLKWTKDYVAQWKIRSHRETEKIVEHLDSIRYSLKPVMKILIDKQGTYSLCLSNDPGAASGGYGPDSDKQIQVSDYKENGCEKLFEQGYKCYVHNISNITGNGRMLDYNTIGGLKFYISGKNGVGDNDIEIKLHNGGDSGDNQISQLTYNTCMQNIYVFFYCNNGTTKDCKSRGSSNNPTAPLMLYYNKNYYRPKDIDSYFKKWVPVTGLESVKEPCGDTDHTPLLTKLKEVNKSLNRINLTHNIGTTGQYGIPKPERPPNEPNIKLERIEVKKIPNEPKPDRPYCKLVHRTINESSIGDIWYGQKEITSGGGITINGGSSGSGSPTIAVDKNSGTKNHTQFVNTNNNTNTVVVYYSSEDTGHKFPQLIVLLQTPEPISDDTEPIKALLGTKYGYYVLSTGDSGGYKYEWRTPDERGKSLMLDDETEYSLLNAIVIMVEKQEQYKELEISQAVSTSKIRSPGNKDGVNRLTGKDINVSDQTGSRAVDYGDPGKCVSKYGYKLFAHDITVLVEWKPNGGSGLSLIGGLRFLVPRSDTANSYQEIKLYQNDAATDPVDRLYHISSKDKVHVYFFGSDPRPLLLCYGGTAYKPKNPEDPKKEKQVSVDYKKWTRVTSISQCTCLNGGITGNDDNILNTLLEVVLFLNPVQLNPKQIPESASSIIAKEEPPKFKGTTNTTYNIHQYTPSTSVKIIITRTNINCYDKYTYEPGGITGTRGDGFRLGTVIYTHTTPTSSIKTLNYTDLGKHKYLSLVKVTVYYYEHDRQYDEPLLIELTFDVNWVIEPIYKKEYWKLTKNDGPPPGTVDWELDPYAQKQIDVGDNQKLVSYLDKIRYPFKKVLQICIAIKKSDSYKAKLFDKNSDNPLESKEQIQVKVSEEQNCPSLQNTGFRCFNHQITKLESKYLHKIGALEFFIPEKDSTNLVKLNLYGTPSIGLINQLYYNCGIGDIYVYFYGSDSNNGGTHIVGDPRPLLLCYNNKGYRSSTLYEYDNQIWYQGTKITECPCDKNNGKNLLKALVHVSNFLNPVNILERPSCMTKMDYTIHKFNGKEITIEVSVTTFKDSFCYHKYTHTHNGTGSGGTGFRMGNITYNSDCIVEKNYLHKCITSLLDNPSETYQSATQIMVYYYKLDTTRNNPLLVALCKKEANGCTQNVFGISTTNTCTCQLYYELQRPSDTTKKIYKKGANSIDLSDGKGGKLEKTLDRILYYITKSLLIDLSFRATRTTESKYLGKYREQTIKIIKNKYSARVYINELGSNQVKTSARIRVQVSDPTDIKDASGKQTGYMCYQHKLTTISYDEQIRGLRLFLWDNRKSSEKDTGLDDCTVTEPTNKNKKNCCEIKLFEQCSQGSKPQDQEIDPIAYTTCKGDLYVYFYGSDPRPLLLCYNGDAYKPEKLETYNQRWCRDTSVESCECSADGFKPSEKLLNTLYQISMFLNPVKLSETIKAYNKVVKPELERRKKAKETGEPTAKLGADLPEYDYKVQTFGNIDINIKVQATDLLCYRQYTFESAMVDSGGVVKRNYRLGDILYGPNNTRTSEQTCLQYPQELPLQSVSLYYYMYDKPHHYPLIIQLDYGFQGPLDDYYRVCKTDGGSVASGSPGSPSNGSDRGASGGGANGTVGTDPISKAIAKNITWVKIKCPVTNKGSDNPQAQSHAKAHSDAGTTTTNGTSSSGTSTTSNGKCDPACNNPTTPEGTPLEDEIKKELNEKDAEFVKRAHEIQMEMRADELVLGHPRLGYRYIDFIAELQWHIERRCYDVRKKFEIKYDKGKDNENLILATDENCHEDSIIGYVLGGGAVGVAGGGGWKFALVVLSMFIKL